jgi:hypothetical protein
MPDFVDIPGSREAPRGTSRSTPPRADARAFSGSAVAVAQATLEHAAVQYASYLASLPADEAPSEAGAFRNTDAAKAATVALGAVRDLVPAARAEMTRLRADLRPPADAAGQIAAQRQWQRHRQILDRAEPGTSVALANRLLTNADPAELATIVEELPSYLAARGQDSTWVDDVVANNVPKLGAARDRLARAKRAAAVIEQNHTMLAKAYEQDTRPPQRLVDAAQFDPDA